MSTIVASESVSTQAINPLKSGSVAPTTPTGFPETRKGDLSSRHGWTGVHALAWAVNDAPIPPLKAALLPTLCAVAKAAGHDGRGTQGFTVAKIAYYARKKERQVQRDLRELEDLGLIRRGDQSIVARWAGDGDPPVVYDVAMERKREPYQREARARYRGGDSAPESAQVEEGVTHDTPPVDNRPAGHPPGPKGVSPVTEEGVVHDAHIESKKNKETPLTRVRVREAVPGKGEEITEVSTSNPTPVTISPDPLTEIVAAVLALPRTHLSPAERAGWTAARVRAALADPAVAEIVAATGADLAAAALACYSDRGTRFPGRLRGAGPWWNQAVPPAPRVPAPRPERGVKLPPDRLGDHLARARAAIARADLGGSTP